MHPRRRELSPNTWDTWNACRSQQRRSIDRLRYPFVATLGIGQTVNRCGRYQKPGLDIWGLPGQLRQTANQCRASRGVVKRPLELPGGNRGRAFGQSGALNASFEKRRAPLLLVSDDALTGPCWSRPTSREGSGRRHYLTHPFRCDTGTRPLQPPVGAQFRRIAGISGAGCVGFSNKLPRPSGGWRPIIPNRFPWALGSRGRK